MDINTKQSKFKLQQELFMFIANSNASEKNYENDVCVNNVFYAFVENVVDVVQYETAKPLKEAKFESVHVNEYKSNFYFAESSDINLHVEQ